MEHSFDGGRTFVPRGTFSFVNRKAAITSSTKQLSKVITDFFIFQFGFGHAAPENNLVCFQSVKWTPLSALSREDVEQVKQLASRDGRYHLCAFRFLASFWHFLTYKILLNFITTLLLSIELVHLLL